MAFESFISVTVPAADRNLLTLAQLRAAAGVSDASMDARLLDLGKQASAAIAKACRVVDDGINPPTLMRETIVETFRRETNLATGSWPFIDSEKRRNVLFLSRFPVSSITSIIADGTVLTESEYELRKAEGGIARLSNDSETTWVNSKIIATYQAGYAEVPDDLVMIAGQLVSALFSWDGRDTNVKVDGVDGIGRTEWFQTDNQSQLVSPSIIGALVAGGFVNPFLG